MHHHHTQEEKQAAVGLYISSGFSPAAVKRALGYPSRSTLPHWHHDYLRRGYARKPEKRPGKFTEEQKRIAVERRFSTRRNGLQTVRGLGYPSRTLAQPMDRGTRTEHAQGNEAT